MPPQSRSRSTALADIAQSRKPFASFGNGSNLNNENPRPANGTTFGSGFGTAAGWNGGIWSTAIGSGLKSGPNDSGRALGDYCCPRGFSARLADASLGDVSSSAPNSNEAITGSGSLLSSSESDGFSGRHATPWKSVDDPSPGLTKVHSNHSNASVMHRQNSSQLASQSFSDTSSAHPSYFSTPQASMGPPNKPNQTQFLDSTQANFVTSTGFDPMKHRTSRQNSDEETRPTAMNLAFGGIEAGLPIQSGRQNYYPNFSEHNSSAASRSGSIPPSRHDPHQSVSRHVDEMPRQQTSQFGSAPSHRPHLSAQGSTYPSNGSSANQKFGTHSSSADLGGFVGNFDKLSLSSRGNNTMYSQPNRDTHNLHDELSDLEYVRQPNGNNASEMWEVEESYMGNQTFSPGGLHPGSLPPHEQAYRGSSYGTSYSHSPSNSETRRIQHSPYYSSSGTPSGFQHRAPSRASFNNAVAPGQAALLDRKLRGLQQEQQGYQPNPLQYRQLPQHYDYHPQHALRMNPLAAYYPMGPMPGMLNQPIPRGSARDQDIGQHLRSALLEEFRSNSKTNKRYELKVSISLQVKASF